MGGAKFGGITMSGLIRCAELGEWMELGKWTNRGELGYVNMRFRWACLRQKGALLSGAAGLEGKDAEN